MIGPDRRPRVVPPAIVFFLLLPAAALAQDARLTLRLPDFQPAASRPGPRFSVANERETARPAPRQTPAGLLRGWEIEVHTGGGWTNGGGSSLSLPPAGAAFTLFNGLQSRAVRSWYFGDGAAFLNAHLASASLAPQITALDAALETTSMTSTAAAPIGVRVSRSLSPRLSFEFTFDVLGSVTLTDEATAAAEATRASFETAWMTRLNALTAFSGRVVTSALTTGDGGRQTLATGALVMHLKSHGRMTPFVVAGAGVWMASGDPATMTLAGDYRFLSGSNTPYRQQDNLTVKFQSGTSAAFLAGGGVTYALNGKSGIRADLRAHFGPDPSEVQITWNPVTVIGPIPLVLSLSNAPAIQISNVASVQSTLGFASQPDFVVASADGMRTLMSLGVGYYYRFGEARSGQAGGRTPARQSAAGPSLWQGNQKWEVDVYAGGAFGGDPDGGTAGTLPVAEPFTAPNGAASSYVSTWMFGGGASFINQAAAAFGSAVSARISPLNSMLTAASLTHQRSAAAGGRLIRRLTPRYSVELALDLSSVRPALTSTARNQMESTRASFVSVWNGIIGTGAGLFQSPQVAATLDIAESGRSWEAAITGALEMRLWSTPTIVTHATFGAGVIRRTSDLPEATLTGSYQFQFGGVAPLSERDVVRAHYDSGSNSPIVLFGGGMKYYLSQKHGIRGDFRVHVASNSIDTLVDATPSITPGSPTFSIASFTNPAIVFSNHAGVRGNLTGPPISDLRIFEGSGWSTNASITAGYFFRF